MNSPSKALVTGATSGIGKALCRLLASKGLSLIITGRNAAVLQELKNELQLKVQVDTIIADLAKKADRENLISKIRELSPDLVINNAGFGLYGDCLSYTAQEQVEIVEVNVNAVLEITLESARTLISKKKKGAICNISSAAAFQVFPSACVYASSKSFVNQFSQAFNIEMQPYGINVLTTCPGMVDTAFQKRAGGQRIASEIGIMTPEYVAKKIWNQIESKQSIKIIDWKYRFLTYLSKLIPTSLSAALVRKKILNRIVPRPLIKNEP